LLPYPKPNKNEQPNMTSITFGIQNPMSYYPYRIDPCIKHLIGKRTKEISDPANLLIRLKEDVLDLEKFLKDKNYRSEIKGDAWSRIKLDEKCSK
jgi:hypothetical protein